MTAGRVTLALLAIVLVLAVVDRIRGARRSTVARIALAAVRAYQRWISPLRPPVCRFTPSCSAYAVTVIERHGALRGGWLAARRLLRCDPGTLVGTTRRHRPLDGGARPTPDHRSHHHLTLHPRHPA